MNNYEPDIFYDVSKLSLSKKRNLLKDAYDLSFSWHADILKGWSREKIEMDFDEIFNKLKKDSHFVFIHRRGFSNRSSELGKIIGPLPGEYLIETGFNQGSYYLFINCDLIHLDKFIQKYNLKIL